MSENIFESKEKVELREKLNGEKVYLKDIMPTPQMLRAIRSVYTSTQVSLKDFKDKLYEDEVFGKEVSVAETTYSVLNGDWSIDEDVDEYTQNPVVIFTDNKSGQSIRIAFTDHTNKLKFLNEMHVATEVKQENPGMDISGVVNRNALYPKKKALVKVAVGTLAAGLGYLIYSKNKKKD